MARYTLIEKEIGGDLIPDFFGYFIKDNEINGDDTDNIIAESYTYSDAMIILDALNYVDDMKKMQDNLAR